MFIYSIIKPYCTLSTQDSEASGQKSVYKPLETGQSTVECYNFSDALYRIYLTFPKSISFKDSKQE